MKLLTITLVMTIGTLGVFGCTFQKSSPKLVDEGVAQTAPTPPTGPEGEVSTPPPSGPDDSAGQIPLAVSLSGVGRGGVTSDIGGINCNSSGGTCGSNFGAGTTVTLTATADPGYIFSGWSGSGCSRVGACTITMDAAKSVRATFVMVLFSSTRALDTSVEAANGPFATSNIWVMKTDGTEARPLTRLTAEGASSYHAKWSPDGTKIVFSSQQALDGLGTASVPTVNIWVMNADGSHPRPVTQLTELWTGCYNPEWSPDGTKIVFDSPRALNGLNAANPPDGGIGYSTSNIWVVNADGTGADAFHLTSLTASMAGSTNPQWSPDGTKIVFESRRALDGSPAPNCAAVPCSGSPRSNIWVVNADGRTDARPLTHIKAFSVARAPAAYSPQWSPDGTKIAFESSQALDSNPDAGNLAYNLWTVNPDDTGLRPITQLRTLDVRYGDAQWSPDGTKLVCRGRRAFDGGDAVTATNVANIWVVNVSDGAARPLTHLTVLDTDGFAAKWSPDGAKIFFGSLRDPTPLTDAALANRNGNIWVVNADGSGAASPLTHLTAVDATNNDFRVAP